MEINSFFPDNWREIVAKNILTERERLNLNQRQLSELMGKKDPTTISKWENAEGTFNLDVLVSLCKLFGRTPTQMLFEDLLFKPPSPPPKKSNDTEGGDLHRHVERELQEMDVGGVSKAAESPPADKTEIQEMRKKMLEMMLQLESMDAPK